MIICAGSWVSAFLPQLAFINVTWLPPMGVLLAARLCSTESRTGRWFAAGMFTLAFGFSVWIASHPGFASDPVCRIVFARYSHTSAAYLAYASFYWVGLAGMVLLSVRHVLVSADDHLRMLSRQLLIGSLAFILPSLMTSWIFPIPKGAFASIMCHYALLLAAFLARLLYLERQAALAHPESVRQQG